MQRCSSVLRIVTPKYKFDNMQFFAMTVKIRYNVRKIKVVLSHPFLCGKLFALPRVGGWYGWWLGVAGWICGAWNTLLQSCLVFLDCIGCRYIYLFTSWSPGNSERIGSDIAWCMQASRCRDDNAELGCLICRCPHYCILKAYGFLSLNYILSSFLIIKQCNFRLATHFGKYCFAHAFFFRTIFLSICLLEICSTHVKSAGAGRRGYLAVWLADLAGSTCICELGPSFLVCSRLISVVQIHNWAISRPSISSVTRGWSGNQSSISIVTMWRALAFRE